MVFIQEWQGCSQRQRRTGARSNLEHWGNRILGNFHADQGIYILNLDVHEDESRLNSHEPRLVIFESGGKFWSSSAHREYVLLALLLLVPVGIGTIIRAAILRRQEKLDVFARGCCLTHPAALGNAGIEHFEKRLLMRTRAYLETVGGHRLRKRRPSKQWPFSRISWFGLIAATTCVMVFIAMSVAKSLDHVVSTGLRVRLLRPGVTAERSPGIQPLRVRVASDGRSVHPRLYVDSQLVSWQDFGALLQKELSRRPPDWPVYVEGDPDMEWRYAAETIDAIRGLRAEVVLLTEEPASPRGQSRPTTNPNLGDVLQPSRP
jgi:hypothetical protein